MARDLVTRAVAEQLEIAKRTGGSFDTEPIREAVYATERGDGLDTQDLQAMATQLIDRAQDALARDPAGPGGSTRIRESIVLQQQAADLRRLAQTRMGQQG